MSNTQILDEAVDKAIEHGGDVQFTFNSPAQAAVALPYLAKKLKEHGLDLGEIMKTKTKKAIRKAVNEALFGDKATKGTAPAGTGHSDPQDGKDESAEMERIVTKAAEIDPDNPALKVLFDPASSGEAKRVALSVLKQGNGGDIATADVKPTKVVDSDNLNAILQPGDLAKMRIEWNDCTDPVEKAALGERLTFETLRALHHTPTPKATAQKSTADDPAPIAKLRELINDPDLDPAVKMQAGEVITKHDLTKSTYTDSQEATNRLVAETQARVTANQQSATGGQTGGFSGEAHLAPTGKIEPEPAAQLGQLEEELAQVQKESKPHSISDREVELRNEVTRLRLALTHGG